ncbi:Levodione reductase [Pseudovibrio sp. Ad5]|uniref:SDR family NAD(P)-dependent oxidoreductase n=1 Tax=Pseudovibrio sp. Ad5 TaxID=989436 RepID=UPI0007AE39D4|nr:SDR family NAD(P)-dependent oxidoreductase [Pseudovibrio sp. Ad5]KZK99424.1 Levodione reductase [Pseudovibrio sp. Ad5]
MTSSRRYENKVAYITGAASGLGQTTAMAFANEGASVICADLDLEGAEKVAEKIFDLGGCAIPIQMNVASEADNSRSVNIAMEKFGKINAVYLNAGISPTTSLLDATLEDWNNAVAVNLTGVFLGAKYTAAAMSKTGGGSIVIASSAMGHRGAATKATYAATKHGELGFMKGAAADLIPHNIRVNAICPGTVDTPILEAGHNNTEMLEFMANFHPMERLGKAEEIAQAVLFLCSDQASYITGTSLDIDGGFSGIAHVPSMIMRSLDGN